MFKVDFINGKTIVWSKKNGETVANRDKNYNPRFYIYSDRKTLIGLRPRISGFKGVKYTSFEEWKPGLSREKSLVLRIDVINEEYLRKTVNKISKTVERAETRFFNVDFRPQFRYCIQNGVNPVPSEKLNVTELELGRKKLSNNKITGLRINREKTVGDELKVLEKLKETFKQDNPDLILVNNAQLLRTIQHKIEKHRMDFNLGRVNSFQKLAGENTVSSYGKIMHSNSRFNIPGRVIIDKSNSFLYKETNIEGLLDLVDRSYMPLQELSWSSIGSVLTGIEVKKAYLQEQTLTPWKNWDVEGFKPASTLHKADRGGFIFNPDPEIHEDVYEADFASLFPNIMVKKNISPETVNCSCCDNKKVPELGYTICEKKKGFIPKVLKPLIEDRQRMKQELKQEPDKEREEYLKGSIASIKWILVSCFGYMGHAHASYGSIECHQAIQAYDREIMLEAKEIFEENGYTIKHGIIDSIWVKKTGENAESIQKVCDKVTDRIGIKLELEHEFEWVAFVPRKTPNARISSLNRYFGKKKNQNDFKTAGIEIEQKSICKFVKKAQKKFIKELGNSLNPQNVFDTLEKEIKKLEKGKVCPEDLIIQKTVSKSLENYNVDNRNKAALKRNKINGINVKPGQAVRYIVVNDKASHLEDRIRLEFEINEKTNFDTQFYTEQLIRSCESVLSPLNWDKKRIEKRLSSTSETRLTQY